MPIAGQISIRCCDKKAGISRLGYVDVSVRVENPRPCHIFSGKGLSSTKMLVLVWYLCTCRSRIAATATGAIVNLAGWHPSAGMQKLTFWRPKRILPGFARGAHPSHWNSLRTRTAFCNHLTSMQSVRYHDGIQRYSKLGNRRDAVKHRPCVHWIYF